jgi:DEAD/DEAH box helicase domain-containing protein
VSEQTISIRRLCEDVAIRSARAVESQIAPRSKALRLYLRERMEAMPGEKDSFLSDPVLEAAFPWLQVAEVMQDFAGSLLHSAVVDALDSPRRDLADQRFPRDRRPYEHQVEAWRHAQDAAVRGIMVSSGTGSGKTECFLVPIIDSLVRQLDEKTLIGTQALFIYPLNALINSQRERLSAWLSSFDGRIRYCLYNGETPEDLAQSRQREAPEEVMTRRLLREEPPPIVITNPTMLEYMLVRRKDAPILAKSKGKLRWIVIDEAHTYVGSQAAELSLLLRRVMHAFEVSPAEVKVIATSATISGGGSRDAGSLAEFLAQLAGTDPTKVRVVTGRREVPALPEEMARQSEPLPTVSALAAMSDDERFEAFASCASTRAVRDVLVARARTVSEAKAQLGPDRSAVRSATEVLDLFDMMARASDGENRFLPLRLHLFHRVQAGMWVCCNPGCSGRVGTALDDASWPFGAVSFQRRTVCAACSSLMFELQVCATCGDAYLAASYDAAATTLQQAIARSGDDEFFEEELHDEDQGEEDEDPPSAVNLLIGPDPEGQAVIGYDSKTGKLEESGTRGLTLVYQEGGRFRCTRCLTTTRGRRFRPATVGAPFLLNTVLPTLLEHLPPIEGDKRGLPSSGRRLLTFTDSRQGTAKFAVRAQYSSELNHGRSVMLHTVLAARPEITAEDIEKQRRTVSELEKVPSLKSLLEEQRQKLAEMEGSSLGSKSWKDVADAIYQDSDVRQWLEPALKDVSFSEISAEEVGQLLLYREFYRRPKRESSLETLGLVALEYPAIEAVRSAPDHWRALQRTPEEWRDLLVVFLDHIVRGRSAVVVPPAIERWMALPWRGTFLLGPGQEITRPRQVLWPSPSSANPAGIVAMLAADLGLDLSDDSDRRDLNAILHDVWEFLRPLFTVSAAGYQFDTREHVKLIEVREAWRCPVTARAIARTYRGLTPYGAWRTASDKDWKCEKVAMPRLDAPWWHDASGRVMSMDERRAWLDGNEQVAVLRDLGVWTNLSDRIVAVAPYYRVSEHSAQIDGARLRSYEDLFKRGEINVLSCSTTMEMGVDIGGISGVAMNNAPPSPANFLQRAGRAGRRGEPVTMSFTLCKADPHGQAVFNKPTWPFETPIFVPRVSLHSTRIVRRHVHSLLLSSFLLSGISTDPPKLNSGWWFEAREDEKESPCERFARWCSEGVPLDDPRLLSSLRQLVKGSPLARLAMEEIVAEAGRLAGETAEEWLDDRDVLEDQIEALRKEGGDEAAGVRAAMFQLKRMRAEYLLRDLVTRNFLPGYGFPSDVVEFNTTTMRELAAARRREQEEQGQGREDVAVRRRGYPSRQLDMAIRDYAPGNEVVVDGRVFKSEGVSLNWHRPAEVEAGREAQLVQMAWRCGHCGETNVHPTSLTSCPECGEEEQFRQHQYLQPSGFAVSITAQPTVKLDPMKYIPVELPWISCRKQKAWTDLSGSLPGRMRYSPEGHIFFRSKGLTGKGYVICRVCGRADSMCADDSVPKAFTRHQRLRGGKDRDGKTLCEGNDREQYWRRIWLGASTETDVFELQRDGKDGGGLSRVAAYSVAVALRGALAELLGIEVRELGCAAIPARNRRRRATQSIVLFDAVSGGAGYVANAEREIERLLSMARTRVECSRKCDAACQACLLEWDTQRQARDLSWREALAVLSS